MKTTAPNHAADERKKIIIIILIIIALVAIIAALIFSFTGKDTQTANEDTQTTAGGQSSIQSEGQTDTGDTQTNAQDQANTKDQITTLITQYRTAFASADIESLKTIYNTSDVMNSDVITATAKIITGYENTVCYIKDGMDSTSKVVFIYDDLKIDGIDTLIPNIAYVYVKQKDDGSYYIYPGEYDKSTSDYVYSSDIQKYISELIKDEDINSLYAAVNEKITKAMNDDPQVKAFVEKLTADNSDNSEAPANTVEETSDSAAAQPSPEQSSSSQETSSSDNSLDDSQQSISES